MLQQALSFLNEEIAPSAHMLDSDPGALRQSLYEMGHRRLGGLRIGVEYGGSGLNELEFRAFQEACARASGTFAFLQTQHQSAASLIQRSTNEELRNEYLPKMVDGRRWVGVGFSQLRRGGPPIMRAEPVWGGYCLAGHVPWVTGFSLFHEFLIGATLPDGSCVFGVVPFQNSPSLTFSEPMRLAAMEACETVTADLDGYILTDELVLFVKPSGWIANNDLINITLQGSFALGCARAGLDVLQAEFQRQGHEFLRETWETLDQELNLCRQVMNTALPTPDEQTTDERLRIRAWAIELANRCAHAAVVASAGASNVMGHPAQRVYREALVFSVTAQTLAIKEATLRRLAQHADANPVETVILPVA